MQERCPQVFILDKPRLKSLGEVTQVVRERIFEPEAPVEVKLVERGRPGSPLPGVCEARELYFSGEHPELLVDGFARRFMEIPNLRKVLIIPSF